MVKTRKQLDRKWIWSGFAISLACIALCLYEIWYYSSHPREGSAATWAVVFIAALVWDIAWLFFYRPSRWRKR